jgi:hypothetical protein
MSTVEWQSRQIVLVSRRWAMAEGTFEKAGIVAKM